MPFFKPGRTAVGLLLAVGLAASAQSATSSTDAQSPQNVLQRSSDVPSIEALARQIQKDGYVNVIATLNLEVQFREEGGLSFANVQRQRNRIVQASRSLIAELSASGTRINREYETVPALALRVDKAGLEILQQSSHVRLINEDALSVPSLTQSVPLIGAPNAWASGYDGTGWAVAILDTGIDTSHAFFRNQSNNSRIVAQACFSNAGGGGGKVSLCPNNTPSQTGTGAADVNITECQPSNQICDHGTHVAGIAAGDSSTRKGVAPNADIIAIQVFSRFNSSSECSPYPAPCVKSFTSDQIAGLDYINSTLRNQHQIASVNMSLGGGTYSAYCDGTSAGTKNAIDNLRSNGIATVIATGNGGRKDAIGSPACISTSIAVSSTTKTDGVSSFSDVATIMDLFAPGSNISSSIPGGGYASYDGTSMATPHVAGAWAIMKQAQPAATVAQVLNAFITTGISITDQRSGGSVTKPRIVVDAAVGTIIGSALHTVTPSVSGGHGAILPNAPQSVVENNTAQFNLYPDPGYVVGPVSGTCGGAVTGNSFQTAPVTADCTVIVSYVPGGSGNDLVCSAPINHSIANNINGTSVNWITGDIQNADIPNYHFNPYNNSNQLTFWWNTGASDIAGVSADATTSDFRVLSAGEIVGPLSVWSTTHNPGPAAWAAGADGHLGFRFNCSSIANAPVSGVCYGYAHLITTAPNGFPATLVDYCWNKAGNSVVIPGGSTPAPVIEVNPSSISSSQASDTTTSQTLTIANTGTADLTWSIEEEPSSRPIALGLDGVSEPMATVSLILDDGTREADIGIGGNSQFIFLNRFTPSASDYPFTLNQIQVYFAAATLVSVGDNMLLVVYENTGGNSDPAVGSNLLASFPVTINTLDAWNSYTLPTPVALNGPGDVLIGVVAQETPGTAYFPASMDQTATQQRSWAGWWSTATAPTPPTLPPDATWTLIDSAYPGNWMVRGSGETIAECTNLVDVPWLSVTPNTGTTVPSATSSVTATLDSGGMAAGTYNANLCIASDDPVTPLVVVPVTMTVTTPVAYPITVNVTPAAGGNASCTPNPVTHGGSSTCSATPATGYTFSGWSGACTGLSCTLGNVTAAQTVTATFAINSYTVTASSAGNGSITPASQPVTHGGTATFTVSPANGYHVASVSGDTCTVTGSGSSYSAANIEADCAVTATFERTTYTVTPSVGSGSGTISPDTAQTINANDTFNFVLSPAPGQVISHVDGTCGGALVADVFTIAPATADCTVIAHFADIAIFKDGFEE